MADQAHDADIHPCSHVRWVRQAETLKEDAGQVGAATLAGASGPAKLNSPKSTPPLLDMKQYIQNAVWHPLATEKALVTPVAIVPHALADIVDLAPINSVSMTSSASRRGPARPREMKRRAWRWTCPRSPTGSERRLLH